MASILKITLGVTWFLIACLITYKAWYIVPVIYNTITDITGLMLLQVLFWVGLPIVWIGAVIVAPIFIIIEGYNE